MNTQTEVHRLAAGQALLLPGRSRGHAVLTEGEAVFQAPARWLGGTVVLPAAVRLRAPAVLPQDVAGTLLATRSSSLLVHAVAALGLAGSLRDFAGWIRKVLGRPSPTRAAG